jgi:hypothetical protein
MSTRSHWEGSWVAGAISGAVFAGVVFAAVTLTPAATGDVIADRVIGQLNFSSEGVNIAKPQGLGRPFSVAIDRSSTPNHLWVADLFNNRVLGWADVTTLTTGAAPDHVIGQADFVSTLCNRGTHMLSAKTLCLPFGVAVDKLGNVYVADRENSRVLEYDNPYKGVPTADIAAHFVFGQGSSATNFTTGGSCKTSATFMCTPIAVVVDDSFDLFVADDDNSRVLEYDDAIAPNATANTVFGQGASGTSFTTSACANGIGGNPPISAVGLRSPRPCA